MDGYKCDVCERERRERELEETVKMRGSEFVREIVCEKECVRERQS